MIRFLARAAEPQGPIGDFMQGIFDGVCQLMAGIAKLFPF